MPQLRKKPKIPALEKTTFKNLTTQAKVKFSVPVWLSDDSRYQSHRDSTMATISDIPDFTESTEDDSMRWGFDSLRSFSRRSLGSTSDKGDDSIKPFSSSSIISGTSKSQELDQSTSDDFEDEYPIKPHSSSSVLSILLEESAASTSEDYEGDDTSKPSSIFSKISIFQPLSEESGASSSDDCDVDDAGRLHEESEEWIMIEIQDDDPTKSSPCLSLSSGISEDPSDSEDRIDSVRDQTSIYSLPV